jgi:hypothetical protein
MVTDNCPNCGKPTATEYSERHDNAYCSPITSSECWGAPEGAVTTSWTSRPMRLVAGPMNGAGASTDEGSVTCPACLANM